MTDPSKAKSGQSSRMENDELGQEESKEVVVTFPPLELLPAPLQRGRRIFLKKKLFFRKWSPFKKKV